MAGYFLVFTILLFALSGAPAQASDRAQVLRNPERTLHVMQVRRECLIEIFKDQQNQPSDARAAIDSCLAARGLTPSEIAPDAMAAVPQAAAERASAPARVIYRQNENVDVPTDSAGETGAAPVSGAPPAKGTIFLPSKNKGDGGAKPIFLNR